MRLKSDFIKAVQTKTILVVLLLSTFTNLIAAWDPECISNKAATVLNNDDFINLKADVSAYLTGSWCSNEKAQLIMDLVVLTKPRVCVDIGVFAGSSTLPIAAALKYIQKGKVYAIDAWSNSEAVKYMDPSDANRSWWEHVDMTSIKQQFKTLLRQWKLEKYCTIIQKTSQAAASGVNEGIDFLHLDGDYSKQISLQDVNLYLPKVNRHGYILMSNVFITINGQQPKKDAFCALYAACDMISMIEDENAILFRKR